MSAVKVTASVAASPNVRFPEIVVSPCTVRSAPIVTLLAIPTPPETINAPVVLDEESIVSAIFALTGIYQNRLSIVNFFEVVALVSTIANTSSDATSVALSAVNSENFTSAIDYSFYRSSLFGFFFFIIVAFLSSSDDDSSSSPSSGGDSILLIK